MTAPPSLSILWAVDDLGATGGAAWSYTLARHWAASGCRVSVFHLTGSLEAAVLRPPVELAVAGGARRRRRGRLPAVGAVAGLAGAIRRHDVVVVGTTGKAPILSFVFARLTGTAVVGYSQGLVDESLIHYQRSELVRRLIRWCVPHLDAMLAVSPASAAAAVRFGVPSGRVAEVRTGIDPDEVRARAERRGGLPGRPLGSPGSGEGPSMVAVGTLEPRKGQDRILAALAVLRAQGCPARLSLIGQDGGTRARLAAQARALGVDDLVSFTGFVANPAPLIAEADVLVHAAHSEIIGLVLLEALAVGTPVVAHDCRAGGPALVLDGGRLGTLVDAGTPEVFARAIREVLEGAGGCGARARQAHGARQAHEARQAHGARQAHEARQARIAAAEPHLREHFSPEVAAATGLEYLRRVVARRPLRDC